MAVNNWRDRNLKDSRPHKYTALGVIEAAVIPEMLLKESGSHPTCN